MNIPRELWGEGPWQHEPDKLDWRDERTSLPCAIRRSMVGALCGYVGVPPGHAFFGWSYRDSVRVRDEFLQNREVGRDIGVLDAFTYGLQGGPEHGTIPLGMALRVHYGMTFSGEFPAGEAPCEAWWFGFDCGHAGDLSPALAVLYREMDLTEFHAGDVYRDINYVKGQCELLAFQLRQLEAEFALTAAGIDFFAKKESR